MGTIYIKKYQNTNEQMPKCYRKWYGRIVHRETLGTEELAEHIMKHGTVYTDDVVLGLTRKLMHCIAEQLAEGYKVKLDGIGTLYLVAHSTGVESPEDFDASKNIKKIQVKFLPDQSNSSLYKTSNMAKSLKISTNLKPYQVDDGGDGGDTPGDGGDDDVVEENS